MPRVVITVTGRKEIEPERCYTLRNQTAFTALIICFILQEFQGSWVRIPPEQYACEKAKYQVYSADTHRCIGTKKKLILLIPDANLKSYYCFICIYILIIDIQLKGSLKW